MTRLTALSLTVLSLSLAAIPLSAQDTVTGSDGMELNVEVLSEFDGAWAMTFLPDGRAVVTEKGGRIWLLNESGAKVGTISNAPAVTARGQGGMGDIIIHPDFADNGTVFLSYVERDNSDNSLSGAAVERATLSLTDNGGMLTDREIIWRQYPKVTGNGHYGHRLAIADNGDLYITSGERQKFYPAQSMEMNLGKVIRINQDGTIPTDNPYYENGGIAREIWSYGHRNPLGVDFDKDGQLWVHEMGPKHGDELNKIVRAENYGYPVVSDGDHYSGVEIPDHAEIPIYEDPSVSWVPAISPAGFVIYDGDMFGAWKNDGFIGGLSSKALIRVDLDAEDGPAEAARYEWEKRIREVEQGPDGAIYVLEDRDGRLIRLTPAE